MKIKALLVAVFVAGLAASFALAAKPPKPGKTSTATTATTTTTTTPKCDQVELKGKAAAGSVTFMVTKANGRGRKLVGTSLTLVVPADARIKAKACSTGGAAPFTLRDLHVKVSPAND